MERIKSLSGPVTFSVIFVVMVILLSFVVISCGGGGGDSSVVATSDSNTIDASGIWILENNLNEIMTLDITQNNNNITGSATWAMADNIGITGTANGDAITITVGTGGQYPISLIGNIDGIQISGVWNGYDTQGIPINGTFTGEKDEPYSGDFVGNWSGNSNYYLKDGSTVTDNVTLEIVLTGNTISGSVIYTSGTFNISGSVVNSLCFVRWNIPCGTDSKTASMVLSEANAILHFETASQLFCDENKAVTGISGSLQRT